MCKKIYALSAGSGACCSVHSKQPGLTLIQVEEAQTIHSEAARCGHPFLAKNG
eukprot:COSAG02_NODE_54_length_43941_cov_54.857990_24_plen_53_part_00